MTQTLITSIAHVLTNQHDKHICLHYESQQTQIWQISGTLKPATHCKINLITIILESKQSILLDYNESPFDWNIPGNWRQLGPTVWKIDPHLSTSSFFKWGYLGGWLLYAADSPVDSWPDVFRDDSIQLEQFMTQTSIPLAIASFFDDSEWRVALRKA